jgi:hypothetical protein
VPPPTPNEEWIVAFVNELVLRLRRDMGLKFARLVAANEWVRNQDIAPEMAAKQWAPRGSKALVDGRGVVHMNQPRLETVFSFRKHVQEPGT